MSRIGNLPIPIPAGVTVALTTGTVHVKGPKGQLTQALVDGIDCAIGDDTVTFSRVGASRQARANHGLMRSLVGNMVTGVSAGFTKTLEIEGIGYRADIKGQSLVMSLGYSHPIEFPIPADVQITVEKNTKIAVTGIDKQVVGQIAANIRAFRKPDSYKGKGVRYSGEYIRLKTGKST